MVEVRNLSSSETKFTPDQESPDKRGNNLVLKAQGLIRQNPELHDLKEEMMSKFEKEELLKGYFPRSLNLFLLFAGGGEGVPTLDFDTPDKDVEKLLLDFIDEAEKRIANKKE